jgi:hypothetical protein
MQVFQAIAKSAPRQVTTKYGQRTVIDASGPQGEEITIWRSGEDNSPALRSIANGSRISVGLDSKGKYSLLETPADRATLRQGERLPQPISPTVEAPTTRPMGFAVQLPMEAETKLRKQIAGMGSIEPTPPAATPIDARIAELGRIWGQCLTAAGGSEPAALAIFHAAIA